MKAHLATVRQQVQLYLGKAEAPLGTLVYVQQGKRENSAIAYEET